MIRTSLIKGPSARKARKYEALDELLETTIALKRRDFPERAITLYSKLPFGIRASMDPVQLGRVISILIDRLLSPASSLSIHAKVVQGHCTLKFEVRYKGQIYLETREIRRMLEAAGGKLTVNQHVWIDIPAQSAPPWMAQHIALSGVRYIAVIGGSAGHYNTLRRRFSRMGAPTLHLRNKQELKEWEGMERSQALCILATPIKGSGWIEFIKKYRLGHRCLVVTEHYNSSKVFKTALELGVKLISPERLSTIPILVN